MKSIILSVLVFTSSLLYASERVEITCSEEGATFTVNGKIVGAGPIKIKVDKGACVNVKVTKTGFITYEKNYCNGKGNDLPNEDFIKLEQDDAFNSSISTDIANIDISIKVDIKNPSSWKLLNSIVTSYFDVIEASDKETSYLRTAWASQKFKAGIIRTRFIAKSEDNEDGYKVKLVSEYTNISNVTSKNDEAFTEWNRVLRKYSNLISDLQARLK